MKYRRLAFAASLLMFVIAGACAPGVTLDGLLSSNGGLSIMNVSASDATIFASYEEEVIGTGGSGSYTWSIVSGGLPPGINLIQGTPIAQLTGTPNLTGSFDFTLRVRDSVGRISDQELTIDVENPELSIDAEEMGLVDEGGDGDATPFTFTVTLFPAIQQEVSVDYSTLDGTATVSGLDYIATSGSLVFAPGVTTRTLQVAVLGDTVFENGGNPESFSVLMTNAVNADVTNSGTGNIKNDDAVELQVVDASVVEGNGGGLTELVFLVTLAETTTSDISFTYSTSDGTAIDGSDYTGKSGQSVTIPAGSIASSTLVTVQVTADEIVEVDETFDVTFTIATASEGLAQFIGTMDPNIATVTATITTDSGTAPELATINIDSPSVAEGAVAETTPMVFTVSLDPLTVESLPADISVDYAVSDGTAIESGGDDDYDFPVGGAMGTITFAAPSIADQTITVTVNGDTDPEANEDLMVVLSNESSYGQFGTSLGTGTIDSDDAPGISVDDWSVLEGDTGTTIAQFNVSISHYLVANDRYEVNYTIADGTATESGADNDYDFPGGLATGTVVFDDSLGDPQTKTVDITINGDLKYECPADETLTITLSDGGALGGAVIIDALATGTIQDEGDGARFVFDFNGDCFPDIAVGANRADVVATPDADEGKCYVFLGTGAAFPATLNAANADVIFSGEGGSDDNYFGTYSHGLKDINGDGIDELIVGADNYDAQGGADSGAAYIFFGGDAALPAPGGGPVNIAVGSAAYPHLRINGAADGDDFGEATDSAGDFNGDGINDLVVGARQASSGGAGVAYIIFGDTSFGATPGFDDEDITDIADVIISGEAAGDAFGNTAAGIGDVNDDGFTDVLIGANTNEETDTDSGRAYIFFGEAAPPASLDAVMDADVYINADVTLGSSVRSNTGATASYVGDVNGDFIDDVLVCAGRQDNVGADNYNGAAHIIFGPLVAGTLNLGLTADSDVVIQHSQGSATNQGRLGNASCAGIGDFDGDGINDFVVAANFLDAGGVDRSGAAYLFLGGAGITGYTSQTDAFIALQGSTVRDFLGQSVNAISDLDGDGLNEFIVGAPIDQNLGSPSHGGKCYIIMGGTAGGTYDADTAPEVATILSGETNGDQFSRVRAGH